jgi:predicted Zn-dependent protease
VATAFAVLLNFALAGTADLALAGERRLTPLYAMGIWVLVLGFWGIGAWAGLRERRRSALVSGKTDPQLEHWFCEAQTEYLKGHWIEAETALSKLLARRPGDVEGRLLLASVLRRTRRLAEARAMLEQLGGPDAACRWGWEIRTELARIAAMASAGNSAPEEEKRLLKRAA